MPGQPEHTLSQNFFFLFNHYTYSVEKGKDGDSPMLALRGELWVTGNKGSEWEAHYTGNGFNKAYTEDE